MPQHETPGTGEQEYQTARDFWMWYQMDPDSDSMLVDRDPRVGIESTLQTLYGAHPAEAHWISQQALQTVVEGMINKFKLR